MSKYFELMNQLGRDSAAVQLTRAAPNLPNRYPQRLIDAPEQMSTAGLWRIIRNRKWTIAVFALVVVAIVVTASLLMKPQYEAVGRVVFHRENDSGVLGVKSVTPSLLEDPEDRAAIDTQIGILQTDALAMQVITDLHLDKNPKFAGRAEQSVNEDRLVESFHKSLAISKVKGTRLIEIQFRNTDPRLAADVVNELARAYVDQYYKSLFQVSTQISEFIANQLRELSNKLAEAQRSVDVEVGRIGEHISYEYKSAVGRERMLRSAMEAQKQAADKLNANAIQNNILKHEFETNRKLYEDLLQKQKEMAISASLKSSNIWIVDPARPPKLPAEPKILRNLALSLLFGIFGGVLLAFGLTKMNEKISTLEQALALSPLPSLGVVPLLDAKSKSPARAQLNV